MVSHQTENINKVIKMIKMNQLGILKLKSIILEIKNSLKRFNSRFRQTKESVNIKIGQLRLFSLRSRNRKE